MIKSILGSQYYTAVATFISYVDDFRLEQERDLFEERMDTLSEDLRHAHDTASIARRDLSAKIAQLEGDLSHKNETIRILEGREEALLADKDTLQGN